jgi:hypothetical protein
MTHDERDQIISLSAKTRLSLCATIDHLELAKAELEGRLSAARACDPMQVVTGKTSIETALEVTQRMLDRLDSTFQRARNSMDRSQRASLDAVTAGGHGGAHANSDTNVDAEPLRVNTVPGVFPGVRANGSISPA